MFLSLRQILTPTPLEPLTYLRGYNHQGLSQKYVLGCDIPVYHSINLARPCIMSRTLGSGTQRHLAPEVPLLSQRILLPVIDSEIHDKL